ncbi:MAG: rod shape-determining protein MreD [Desulfuromonadales bacterium]|nr:rod shape-determining protein MreD [Desulfuromonadales bacterium]
MSRRGAFLLIVSILVAVILQTSVLPLYIDTLFKPDLLLVIMVVLALRVSYGTGVPLAWLLGLLKDVFSGLFLGLGACTYLIIFLVIKSVADRLYAESGFLFVITVSAATFASVAINMLLLIMFTNASTIAYSMLSSLLPHLLFNAFAASLVALLPLFAQDENIA